MAKDKSARKEVESEGTDTIKIFFGYLDGEPVIGIHYSDDQDLLLSLREARDLAKKILELADSN